jgi:hypothetical protein
MSAGAVISLVTDLSDNCLPETGTTSNLIICRTNGNLK